MVPTVSRHVCFLIVHRALTRMRSCCWPLGAGDKRCSSEYILVSLDILHHVFETNVLVFFSMIMQYQTRYAMLHCRSLVCLRGGSFGFFRIPSLLHIFSLVSHNMPVLIETGKPTGVAVSHCIAWFQTQQILITCQIRYHSHLWDHVALNSSEP